MGSQNPDTEMGGPRRDFHSTLWTVVLKAQDLSAPDRKEALEKLIESYWKPVYLFVRRSGNASESSKDITQGFFTALLEKNFLKYVDKGRGKFRTFLLAALKHFMADEHDRDIAQKRGGGRDIMTLDFEGAEALVARAASRNDPPDAVFRRDWAMRVLNQAVVALRAEYEASGKEAEFDALRLHLTPSPAGMPSYSEIARQLRLSESDVRNRIHRTRRRYRESILEVIRSYTETDEEAREELKDLFSTFS